ncbi:hypothetical protein [Lachnoclostridium sp.]|uniref:glycoside hydrolase family 38 N-terminal domain-containing protein n=1 Tax=Lachnoclostridium sp. TaxID=2028282 RepID=UPI00289B1BA9|nr:hypothetical protein [Lachnoclostridium sp.]
MELKRKWKIYLMHHSHTDIGYTERQDKIATYHVDFMKQAIDILHEIHESNSEEYKGFVWQCENHWQVENFYQCASEQYIRDFENYVKSGEIGLSGNYLNMTELVGEEVLNSRIAKAKKYGEERNIPISSGMSADINGYAWGYVDALYENGIKNLYSCLHPHHGMFPLYKKMIPFFWESPKGNKILIWSGEHYNFGNELQFAPNAGSTYMLNDEIGKQIRERSVYNTSQEKTEEEELSILEIRLKRYLENLEKENYPFDFVPVMVSGAITDNSPPSKEIAKRVNLLNQKYEGKITFQMATLDTFFQCVREYEKDIPTYKGDWNDWWADGVGSTPGPVKIYKNAQRKLNLCKKLDKETDLGDLELVEKASENLMLYAEHTWGYSSSISEPWETLVGELEMKKTAYAINGNTYASKNLDKILAKKGEVSIKNFRPQHFRVINPHEIPLRTKAVIYVELWEYLDGVSFGLDVPFEVVDSITGKVLPSQVVRIPRAFEIEVMVSLEAKEERELSIRRIKPKEITIKNHAHIGAEGIEDIILSNTYEESTRKVETNDFIIQFSLKKGIEKIINKATNENIVRDMDIAPFSGIYEITPIKGDFCDTRRRMGRNRKAESTKRYYSFLTDIGVVENGEVFIALRLDYQLEGTGTYSVFLKIYKQMPQIDAMVRIHKHSIWEPENLYVALPFTTNENESTYVDKTGCIIRPGIDQLPGSNKEFYLIQNGIVLHGEKSNVIISIKDAPLITFGDLESKPIELCTGEDVDYNRETPYSWIMNNYWETNFKADLGGFYEFAYSILVTENETPKESFIKCEATNEGVLGFYIDK